MNDTTSCIWIIKKNMFGSDLLRIPSSSMFRGGAGSHGGEEAVEMVTNLRQSSDFTWFSELSIGLYNLYNDLVKWSSKKEFDILDLLWIYNRIYDVMGV